MAQASDETVEVFGAQITNIIYDVGTDQWRKKVEEIVSYVASPKFVEEENGNYQW